MVKGMALLGNMVLLASFSVAFGLPHPENIHENRALNRAAYHSSAVDYFQTGHLATDGQKATYWESAPQDQECSFQGS